ncbi:MAG: insulinase family protein [Planctomycetes bacterium]|nr:insulinase family protein [Planctomycetota bacterium]
MKNLLPIALLAAAFATTPATLAQSVPVEKYTLPNGMTVILHEDHALPVATINIWYRVGSQDEPPGRSGFAHLFEHLMFMGTSRVPGSNFDTIMETGGGANNASTDLFRTNYYSWGPSSLLPTLLWLDADRLEDMGLNMTQDKLDKQRDVVRNELRQVVENRPYGKAEEAIWHLMFPPSHPYYTGVIGTHEDLEAANVTNVKDFFANFYVPSNASLVVAGDFKSAEIKPLIEKLFGTLPPGQPVSRKYTTPKETIPLRLDGVKRFTAIDAVQLPKVQYIYHSPRAFQNGDAEMKLTAAILAGGKSSRLYTRLVVTESLAAEVSAAQQSYPLASLFTIDVLARPEANLERVEQIIDEEIAAYQKSGPTPAELTREVASIERAMLSSMQTIERKADALNEYEFYLGQPDSFKTDLDRYRNAKPGAIQQWARQTLNANSRGIIRVLPEEPTRPTSPRDELTKQRPALSTTPLSLPQVQEFALSSGQKVYLLSRPGAGLVNVTFLSSLGGGADPAGKEGLLSLTSSMLEEGNASMDAAAFETAIQSLGGSFGTSSSEESLSLSLSILKRNLSEGVKLFSSVITSPRLESADFDRVRSLALDGIRQADDNPAALASKVSSAFFYGSDHPYGSPSRGSESTVSSLTITDVQSMLHTMINPAHSVLIVAGDATADEIKPILESNLGSLKSVTGFAPRAVTAAQPGSALRVYLVNKTGATQTQIRFIAPGTGFTDPARGNLDALNTIIGGSFTSRLNNNLRETHGYTYGARSSFTMHPTIGSFTAGASVQAAVTGAALKEFFNEFTRLTKGDITADEATKARETVRNDTVKSMASLDGLSGLIAERLSAKLPISSIATDLESVAKAQATDLNTLATSRINMKQGVLVLVGDKATILSQIKDAGPDLAGITITEVDAQGKIVK